MTVLPLEIESVFESIRQANRFQLVDGLPVWVDSFHDEEFTLLNKGQVVDESGNTLFLKEANGLWSTKPSSTDILTPQWLFYECGSIREVVKIVGSELGRKKNMSFPLALLETLDTPYNENGELFYDYPMTMYLCVNTDPKLRPKERYLNSYKEILFPLYEIFKRHIDYSQFTLKDAVPTMRERWGSDGLYGREGNVFNNMVDALEITGTLTFLKETCDVVYQSNTLNAELNVAI